MQHLLASKDTIISTRDNLGNTPLLGAAGAHHKDVVRLLAPWSERSLRDMSKEAKGAAEQFRATVVDFGGYKRGNEVKKVKVYDLLYSDPKTSPNASTSTLSGGSTVFRWIHLPANNVTWCQDLLTRRFIEEGVQDGSGFKALQRSFLHQHGGKKFHSNYMRPGCQAIPRSTNTAASATAPRVAVSAAPPSPASSQFSEEHLPRRDDPQRSGSPEHGMSDNARRTFIHRSDTSMSAQLGALQVPTDPLDGVEINGIRHMDRVQSGLKPSATRRRGSFNDVPAASQQDSSQRVIVHDVAASSEHNVYMFAPVSHLCVCSR